MISLILILKSILVVWLFVKSFRFLGAFLAIHTIIDIYNAFQSSYYAGMISFILVPHVLVACLSELRNIQYLKYANILSFILLIIAVVKYNYTLVNITNYFLLYSITVLLSTKIVKRKEDLLLSIALLLQIIEIMLYRFLSTNYIAINLTNGIYYIIVATYLANITINPPNNTPILDDSSAAKMENPEINIVRISNETHEKKVA